MSHNASPGPSGSAVAPVVPVTPVVGSGVADSSATGGQPSTSPSLTAPDKRKATESEQRAYEMLMLTIAGAGAGAITKTLTAPLERIKIIFQIQGMGKPGEPPKYSGILKTMKAVSVEEGPLALWKGNAANVLRVIPVYGLKFGFNDTFKKIVAGPEHRRLDMTQLMWIGTLSGLFQNIVTYPLETVRTRLTLGANMGVEYKGIADCFRTMVRVEGFGSLYKGLTPTILSGSPYTGIQMTTFELASRASPEGGKTVMWQLINGALSGLIAQTVTYPGDTVRRRMQNNGAGGKPRVYTNMVDCIVKMARQEGIRSFFKGAWTNTVRAVPGAAFQFASYNFCKRLLGVGDM